MDSALLEEETTINAIFPDSLMRTAPDTNEYTLLIARAEVSLRLSIPQDYPNIPPSILGSASSGPDVKKGQANNVVGIARTALTKVFQPGLPCIFDLMQEIEGTLPDTLEEEPAENSNSLQQELEERLAQAEAILKSNPPWVLSEVITEKKSIFVARAAAVSSRENAHQYIKHLLHVDKKVAKATHNITAWRIQGDSSDVKYQDCDDDGETAAGGRLLHLLQLMDVWNVMIVVSRWYGGIHLGPDRFRLINQAARDALVKGGFAHVQGADSKKKRK